MPKKPLKPKTCPWCGGAATLQTCTGDSSVRHGRPFYWVQHKTNKCILRMEDGANIETRYYSKPELAIRDWNTRHA